MLSTPSIHVAGGLRRRLSPRLLAALARRVRRAGQYMGIDAADWSTLGLRIVEDEEMAQLHLRFMGEEGPTDVLSFGGDELDEPGQPALLGDIVVDWDAVERQAQGSLLDEATVLIVHGLAHLLGHDHRQRAEGRAMFALERRVLERLGLAAQARPYAPRLLATAEEASRGSREHA